MTRPAPSAGLGPSSIDYGRWPSLEPPPPLHLRRPLVHALVRRLAERCHIRVELADGPRLGPADGPVLAVRDPDAFIDRLARFGKIGFAESYMAGEWEAPDLVAVLAALAERVWSAVPRPLRWLGRAAEVAVPVGEDNDRIGARRNIARHYDLSNDLFEAFLDETLTYSSALYVRSGEPLAEAQRRKIDRLLDRCGVGPGARVLEIGTGWGELALRAARRQAHVTSITLSEAQAGVARERIARAGLAGGAEVRVQDYREVGGRYDAIVSVEMVEAVGVHRLSTFFRVLDDRLAEGGRIGLQAILMDHARMRATARSWTWTQKYIFPGGLIPSERAIGTAVNRTSLRVVDRLRFGDSYARTLEAWRRRFARIDVERLGFDHTFRRMWDFYLAQSEAGFRTGYLDVTQMVLQRAG
jgi:cyclopropane-fatty-acyl-phospholipid synthase